jgi:hypothetical protein
MRRTESKIWKVVGIIAIAATVIAFASTLYIWNFYYDTLPHNPDKASGRIYVDNFHGFARYETRQEYARLHILNQLSGGLVALVIIGAAVHDWRRRRTDHSLGNE